MQIKIQLGSGDREVEISSRLWRWLKWSWLVVPLWAVATAGAIYLAARLDPLSFVDLEVHLVKDLQVRIDSKIPVVARLDQVISLPVKDTISARVRVDQDFTVPVDEVVDLPLDLTIPVQVDQDVRVTAQVPLRAEIPVEGQLFITLPGLGERPVTVRGRIPVDMTVPVDQKVRVKDVIPVRINETVKVRIQKSVRVPLHDTIAGQIALDTAFTVPLATEIRADVFIKDTVRGEIDQTLILDKDQFRVRSDRARTEEVKRKVFSQLPGAVKEGLEKELMEGK